MENASYTKLLNLSTRASLYSGIGMILEWDLETYMPKKGGENRASQVELIASLIHKEKTSPEFVSALESLVDLETGEIRDSTLSDEHKAALREWRRDYIHEAKLPTEFVEKFAKVTSLACHAWKDAKEENDFKAYLPHLEKVVDLCRKKADFLGYEEHPYDALVDCFEPNMRTKVLAALFERLKIPLTSLIKKIETKKEPESGFLREDYPHDKQIRFGKKILTAMGFDKSFSRLDESAHPMCIPIHPDDTRMTTRVYPNNVLINLLSCIHEGGHGLYHSNLPSEHFGSPLGEAASLGIDESQSRLWETILGRSLPFWQHFFPLLQKEFPEQLAEVQLQEFYQGMNTVRPSMIRTDSDEVTYNLHIMVRFEMEKALIEGKLKVEKIPEAWNEKMREYLGITPKADSEGCLQDIHWSLGAIGYFPTYTLGNLYAGQIFETLKDNFPDWKENLAKGELSFIRDWTKREIHQHGRRYLPDELCKRVTGKPLSEKPFIDYLEKKYTALYHL
ncbi:MAG: Thermostable carboxypeptidase 1 [Chlamydiae bacterium]|nr:Thermostable carboxypeptidase 1 [Chlamydiota bacterium]